MKTLTMGRTKPEESQRPDSRPAETPAADEPSDKPGTAAPVAQPAERKLSPNAMTHDRRTQLRRAFLANGTLTNDEGTTLPVSNLVLEGVRFRSAVPMKPGDIRQLATAQGSEAKLLSAVRVVSCRLRQDGHFDIGAEFF